jgi:hypothetical protein
VGCSNSIAGLVQSHRPLHHMLSGVRTPELLVLVRYHWLPHRKPTSPFLATPSFELFLGVHSYCKVARIHHLSDRCSEICILYPALLLTSLHGFTDSRSIGVR